MEFLIEALTPRLNAACVDNLDCPRAQEAWYNKIDEHGSLEIAACYSIDRTTSTIEFTASNQAEIDAYIACVDALYALGEEDMSDELAAKTPSPDWEYLG